MKVWKMIVVGIGMLAFLLGPLQPTAQARREGSDQGRDKHRISEKTDRSAQPKRLHRSGRGKIERSGRGKIERDDRRHGKIDRHRGGHGYHRDGRSHRYYNRYYKGHRHYAPSRHWKYYRHSGGHYAFDGSRWYFRHDGRWYYHVRPSWHAGCGGGLILDPLFPWTFSFAFPGYYDCP